MRDQDIAWDGAGLVPVVVQHAHTSEVLMVAWMNAEALARTRGTGLVHFWSRSRETLWQKGETSGNVLALIDIALDCDGDTVLVKAVPSGPTCHTGSRTCFSGPTDPKPQGLADLDNLWNVISDRLADQDAESYTVSLASGGAAATGRKVIEEAAEVAEAGLEHQKGGASDQRVAEEVADVLYHLFVLLAERDISPATVLDELRKRRPGPTSTAGPNEKAGSIGS